MCVHPVRSAPALLVVCSLRLEKPHDAQPGDPAQFRYRNQDRFIVMCSNCRRTRRPGSDTWDWVPDFVAHLPPLVSHGLCKLCLEYYYPPET
jgi:hypothetical protein